MSCLRPSTICHPRVALYGSASAVEGCGLTDLEAVEGVSGAMAKKIYDWFHTEG